MLLAWQEEEEVCGQKLQGLLAAPAQVVIVYTFTANKNSIPLASLGIIILSLAPVTQSRAQFEPQVCTSAYVMALNGRGNLP